MSDNDLSQTGVVAARKRRSDGERSRSAILREAAQLATLEGIEGLSINRLAKRVGMSKSGLFAHFGSKQELQLATIEAAGVVFSEQVIEPAMAAPSGLERLQRLAENYLRHVESAYPGGCFFASLLSEIDTHAGAVRNRAVEFMDGWIELLETTIWDAQTEQAIDPHEDPAQLAFEVEAFLILANTEFVVRRTQIPLDRARRAIDRRLQSASVAA
ncbi:MAG TPA: TetR/AcrR family transcriptional regulator [Gaiellaceae bacterium]